MRRWIVAAGVIAIVANLGSAAYDQWRSYRQAVDNASRELVNVSRILAEQTRASLGTLDVLLRDTAEWYAHRGARSAPGAIDAALANRAEGLPQLFWMTITDANGIHQYRSRPAPGVVAADVSDRSYFFVHRDDPTVGLFVSEPILMRTAHRHGMALSRRLTDGEGRFAGVVTGFVDLDWFQQFYRQINLGPQSVILLLHDNGSPVLREPPLAEAMGRKVPALVALSKARGDPTVRFVSPIDGVRRLAAGARVDGLPLMVVVNREEAAILGPWREEAVRVAARTLVITVLIGAAIAALVWQLRRVELSERALRESEERYALAMEAANEGHFDWSLEGGPSFASPRMKTLFGFPADAPFATEENWLARVHPDDRPRVKAEMAEDFAGQAGRFRQEYRVRQADGEWHWVLVRGRRMHHPDGKPYRLVGSVSDITERKRAEAEKERLEAELRKSQKMEAMGTLAGGIAHDFNNILGAILGYGELAQKSSAEGSVVRRYIDNVMQAGGRAKALVERILAFSRSGLGERSPVNVQAVIEETLELLAASLPPGVQLERKLAAEDAAVIGDATQLHQVAMNLCTNAVQAMPGGGTLEVLLERVEIGERRALSHGELGVGPYLRLAVRDTGTGIKPEVLDRIFDPFFTTKGVGKGTGLGLSLVHGIIADMGGAIDVASAPGQGTTFAIWLPVAGSAPRPAAAADPELPRGSGQVVMVVDDEPALVALAEELLAELGYEPVGFESSPAALQEFRADPQRFDLVLSDEMMPELTGTGLALEIRRVRADIPIVLMSGYMDSSVTALARAAGVIETLRKPLQARDIAECFARVLSVTTPTDSAGA